jgi:hypothetical protein
MSVFNNVSKLVFAHFIQSPVKEGAEVAFIGALPYQLR